MGNTCVTGAFAHYERKHNATDLAATLPLSETEMWNSGEVDQILCSQVFAGG